MSPSQPSAAPLPPQDHKPGDKAASGGWLGSQSIFDSESRDPKRTLGGVGVSMILHSVIGALLLFTFIQAQDAITDDQPKPEIKMVYLQQPGPGGGGGGSPAPAPPKPMEIPKHAPPPPTPVVVTPPPPPVPIPEPPKPQLNAPVETNAASVLQATGASTVSLASYGGGGRGGGIGAGTGSGVGEGTGGGFGGGAYRAGSGIIDPTLIVSRDPKYTSQAMLAKIQGDVELEAVVMPDGSIGDVRVTKSLDKNFGLDQEAIVAAKQWKFRPGKDRDGKAVPVIVTLILTFRLH